MHAARVRVCIRTHTDDDRTKTTNYRPTFYTTASNAHSPKVKVAKTSDNESRRDSGSHSIAEQGNKANLGKIDDPRTEATPNAVEMRSDAGLFGARTKTGDAP